MLRTRKEVHTAYCNYMVNKASENKLILIRREVISSGIKTSGLTREELINELAK